MKNVVHVGNIQSENEIQTGVRVVVVEQSTCAREWVMYAVSDIVNSAVHSDSSAIVAVGAP